LMTGVGGQPADASSFRLVTSGMSGLESCRKNALDQITTESHDFVCSNVQFKALAADDKQTAMAVVLQQLVASHAPAASKENMEKKVIGVLCGNKSNTCASLADMQQMVSLEAEVVPIYACESFDNMMACEEEVKETVKAATLRHKKLDILVLDVTFPYAMAQVFEKLFRDKVFHSRIMEEFQLVVTPVPHGENWRTVFLDRFRTDLVLFDPAHRANLRITNADTGNNYTFVDWCLFSSGDEDFFKHLSSAVAAIEAQTGMKTEVDEVANGIINTIAEFQPPKIFKDSDYDRTRAVSQWTSQTPVGHQTIFQMALQPPKTGLEIGEEVLAMDEPGPWDMVYVLATVVDILEDEELEEDYLLRYQGGPGGNDYGIHPFSRDQIRKFSEVDEEMSASLEVGDLVLYEYEDRLYTNGVISQKEEGHKYSIYLLNTDGRKLHGVPRSSLMHQFESADFIEDIPDLSIPELLGAFAYALKTEVLEENEQMSLIDSFPIGAGVVQTAFWKGGHAILKWDGSKQVEINLFTYEEDFDLRLAFQEAFTGQLDYVQTVARDEQPRGYGGIVNFASEIESPPHWIEKILTATE